MRKTNLPTVLDSSEYLEVANGKMIELGSTKFFEWLNNPDNRSFRFIASVAGNQSFTARKETSKKGEGDYWYGYRRVEGKLHKRYLGKAEDVTLRRLKEVALALESTPKPRQKATKTDEVTQNISVTNALEIARLQAEISRLQNELCNTQAQLEGALGESAA
jgi:hypothetical protein